MDDLIRVDPSFLREVRRYGRFDVSGCFNCGTCTLCCDLSADGAAFPRRSMQYVLLGLREKVNGSLEPWLCHDCGDCSARCPQEAEPRESMATLRRYLTAQYDWTGLAGRIHVSKAWSVGSIVTAGLLVVALMVWYHLSVAGMAFSDLTSQSMGLSHMFPTITWFTVAVILIPGVFLSTHAVRMYRFAMGRKTGTTIPPSLFLSEAKTFFVTMATQERMDRCRGEERRGRRTRHWMIAAGCFLIVFLLLFFLRFFQTDEIHPIYHPQRWLGYLATAFLLYGTVDILAGRLAKRGELYGHSDLGDYTFPVLLFLTTVSGIGVHVLRYAGLAVAAHYTYLAHLVVAVPLLVVEIPFGKGAHMLYRPLAVYFQSVREKADAMQPERKPEAA